MSTFDGFIKEFPDITGHGQPLPSFYILADSFVVDHFTLKPTRPPPRAAFLSHVHKDHMSGLETYASSFVYCSHATKQVWLSTVLENLGADKKLVSKLQTKRDRLDFADGTIEKKIYSYSTLLHNKKLLVRQPFSLV
jgi:ribonuclease BN (tRNA processing enzyme)